MTEARINSRRPAHGFAAVTAIVLVGLVAATLVALGVTFTADARRARAENSRAQLRQLLIAGAVEARQHIDKGEAEFEATSTLPSTLADEKASLVLNSVHQDGHLHVRIVAKLGNRQAEQTLQFDRSGDVWKLAGLVR